MDLQELRKVRAFWWGRVIPKQFVRLNDLSKIDEESLEILKSLRKIVLEADKIELKLGWGQMIKKKEVFS